MKNAATCFRNALWLLLAVALTHGGVSLAQVIHFIPTTISSERNRQEARSNPDYSPEQVREILALCDEYDRYFEDLNRKWKGQPRSRLGEATDEALAYTRVFWNKLSAVKNRPKPAAQSAAPQPVIRQEPNPDPVIPQKPSAHEVEEKILNQPKAYPDNPFDHLDQIPGMNVTPDQKTKIKTFQKERRSRVAKVVKRIHGKKRTGWLLRFLFYWLKRIVIGYNYRVERILTRPQIIVLREYQRRDDRKMLEGIERPEQLLGDIKLDDIFDERGEEMTPEPPASPLTRTNFYEFEELARALGLSETQRMALAGLDAEKAGLVEHTEELLHASERNGKYDSVEVRAILEQGYEDFESVHRRIEKAMLREQWDNFDALSVFLFDGAELPGLNDASFRPFRLEASEQKRIRDKMVDTAVANIDKILDPRLSYRERNLVRRDALEALTFLNKEKQAAWQKKFEDYPTLRQSVKKLKQTEE